MLCKACYSRDAKDGKLCGICKRTYMETPTGDIKRKSPFLSKRRTDEHKENTYVTKHGSGHG